MKTRDIKILEIIAQLYFQIFFNLTHHGSTKFASTIKLYSTSNRLSGICERNNHKVSEGKTSRKGKFKVTALVSSNDNSKFVVDFFYFDPLISF